MISLNYESLLTGSELKWGNSAAHQDELQALVAKRRKKFCNLFLGSQYFAKRLNRLLTKMAQKMAKHVTFLAQFWDYNGDLGGVFGSPSIAD